MLMLTGSAERCNKDFSPEWVLPSPLVMKCYTRLCKQLPQVFFEGMFGCIARRQAVELLTSVGVFVRYAMHKSSGRQHA